MKTDLNALRKGSVFAEEAFVVEVQSLLETIMHEKSMTRADLAAAMGVSRPRVTQMFSSDCTNFTMRLLARALHAMGEKAELTCEANRVVQRRKAMADLWADARRFETDWSFAWEGNSAMAANDHGLAPEDLEVAAGNRGHDLQTLVVRSLQRAHGKQRAVA
jgi:predicted XRE-type DNA-binding protein